MSDAIENQLHCIGADRGKLYIGSNPPEKCFYVVLLMKSIWLQR
jgi:hypothetical protein